jgi:hypothetical protein
MKLLTGAILLVGAEQAFAHSLLVQFPNQDVASRILVPASLVLLTMGTLFMFWGLMSEVRTERHRKPASSSGFGVDS